jgi:hypothetical protein
MFAEESIERNLASPQQGKKILPDEADNRIYFGLMDVAAQLVSSLIGPVVREASE